MGRRRRRRRAPALRRRRLAARRPAHRRLHVLAASRLLARALRLERAALRLRVPRRPAAARLGRGADRAGAGGRNAPRRLPRRRAGAPAVRRTRSARRLLRPPPVEQLDRDLPARREPAVGRRLHGRARGERVPLRRLHDGRLLDVAPGLLRVLREGLPRPEGDGRPHARARLDAAHLDRALRLPRQPRIQAPALPREARRPRPPRLPQGARLARGRRRALVERRQRGLRPHEARGRRLLREDAAGLRRRIRPRGVQVRRGRPALLRRGLPLPRRGRRAGRLRAALRGARRARVPLPRDPHELEVRRPAARHAPQRPRPRLDRPRRAGHRHPADRRGGPPRLPVFGRRHGRRRARGLVRRARDRRAPLRPLGGAPGAPADDAVLGRAVAAPLAGGRRALPRLRGPARRLRALHPRVRAPRRRDRRADRPRDGVRVPGPGLRAPDAAVHARPALARRARPLARRHGGRRAPRRPPAVRVRPRTRSRDRRRGSSRRRRRSRSRRPDGSTRGRPPCRSRRT